MYFQPTYFGCITFLPRLRLSVAGVPISIPALYSGKDIFIVQFVPDIMCWELCPGSGVALDGIHS